MVDEYDVRRAVSFDVRQPGFNDEDWNLLRHLSQWRFTSARNEVRPEHGVQVKELVGALAAQWGDRGLSARFESEATIVRAALEWLYLLLSDVPVQARQVQRTEVF